ncbi:peptide/nickel transport system substrate-binding protein [Alkalibacillus filiformis]|uniref:Peptide/nickel transport system substrate-binding protein n=1 Tax=Alkalibacillus filiformis TaxID=200990 RepID=A0ABU0DW16_9BACI|nr:oligopeptide ABC transporter substrate-binding protein [Alkalibacillus filiformis]MDQ0352606.1 peptide/nickel transport system substrate-binding protein [Alkalibacillus filiformis]
MSKSLMGKYLFVLMLALFLVLAACGGDDEGAEDPSDDGSEGTEETEEQKEEEEEEAVDPEDQIYDIDDFSTAVSNDGDPIDGGSLNYGLVSDTVFEGTLNFNFYGGTPDFEILQWIDEALLSMDENYTYTQDGAATFEADQENNSITFTIRDDVQWHDGEELTAEDWVFSYEVIADPEYTGVRYGTAGFTLIEGIEQYREGETDSIPGIEIHDEKSFTINYERLTPSLLTGGVWTYALPKHIFGDIPVAEMEESDAVRQEPIGIGPFMVDSIVPGESVSLVKNENYWRGEPNLDEVTVRVINPSVVVQELETGGVDLVSSFPVDQYPENSQMENVEFLGQIDMAYTYIGFKLGDWDEEASKVNYMPDEMKMGDVELRRAMWYAVDNDTVGERFYNGLRWAGTTLIAPSHPDYHDDSIEVPTFEPEEAERILDEAGYEDVTGDGFRETPDGEELVINFASMSGGDVAEPIANYYVQSWQNVGLNVQLLDGRLHEFNSFYDRVGNGGNDDPDVDIYMGAWSVGSDVDPSGLYGSNAMFNFPRYESEENDRLLEEGISEEAFDVEYRQEVYSEWQEFMVEEIPVFPTLYRSELRPANLRVTNYNIEQGSGVYLHELGVTQEEPVVAE